MKNLLKLISMVICLVAIACSPQKKDESSAQENEWTVLFDGSSLEAWRGFKMDSVPSRWRIEDGALTCLSAAEGDSLGLQPGDIMTRQKFENFELSLEWKISEGGNSGIIYFANETDSSKYAYYTGPELQVLDNEMAGDNLIKHMAGDLYDLISCSQITVKPAGEWNTVRIIADGSHVQHWLNGVMVVEYDLFSDEIKEMIKTSKWKDYPEFGLTANGYIDLQDHGDQVWFRNIKIRSL